MKATQVRASTRASAIESKLASSRFYTRSVGRYVFGREFAGFVEAEIEAARASG